MTATIDRPAAQPIRIVPAWPKVWPTDRFARFEGRPADRPTLGTARYLQIELTNHCDLQCVECPQRLMDRKRQWMDMDVLETIFDKLLGPYAFDAIIPHKDGESLLYPHILPALAAMSRVHAGKFIIYTNGTHFTKAFYDTIRALDNAFQVFVSFHQVGFTGKDWNRQDCTETKEYSTEKADATLLACLAEPAPNVEFAISSHVTPFVDRERMEAWKARWDDVAAQHPQLNGVHLNTAINPWGGHMKGLGTVTFDHCPYDEGEHLFVGVTGAVLPCCMDLNEELVVGDIMVDSCEEIVARMEDFYRRVGVPSLRKERCVECLSVCGNGGCS